MLMQPIVGNILWLNVIILFRSAIFDHLVFPLSKGTQDGL